MPKALNDKNDYILNQYLESHSFILVSTDQSLLSKLQEKCPFEETSVSTNSQPVVFVAPGEVNTTVFLEKFDISPQLQLYENNMDEKDIVNPLETTLFLEKEFPFRKISKTNKTTFHEYVEKNPQLYPYPTSENLFLRTALTSDINMYEKKSFAGETLPIALKNAQTLMQRATNTKTPAWALFNSTNAKPSLQNLLKEWKEINNQQIVQLCGKDSNLWLIKSIDQFPTITVFSKPTIAPPVYAQPTPIESTATAVPGSRPANSSNNANTNNESGNNASNAIGIDASKKDSIQKANALVELLLNAGAVMVFSDKKTRDLIEVNLSKNQCTIFTPGQKPTDPSFMDNINSALIILPKTQTSIFIDGFTFKTTPAQICRTNTINKDLLDQGFKPIECSVSNNSIDYFAKERFSNDQSIIDSIGALLSQKSVIMTKTAFGDKEPLTNTLEKAKLALGDFRRVSAIYFEFNPLTSSVWPTNNAKTYFVDNNNVLKFLNSDAKVVCSTTRDPIRRIRYLVDLLQTPNQLNSELLDASDKPKPPVLGNGLVIPPIKDSTVTVKEKDVKEELPSWVAENQKTQEQREADWERRHQEYLLRQQREAMMQNARQSAAQKNAMEAERIKLESEKRQLDLDQAKLKSDIEIQKQAALLKQKALSETTPTDSVDGESSSSSSWNGWAWWMVLLLVIGIVILVSIVISVIVYFVKRRNASQVF